MRNSWQERERRNHLLQGLFTVAVVVGLVVVFWLAGAEARDGRPGQHWVCTKVEVVFLDRFNGTEEECVAGYWERD